MTDLLALEKRHIWHPFTAMQAWCADDHEPLFLASGQGCRLRDQHGREYLDGNSSIWTNVHGHNHPTINAAIRAQLDRVAHTSFLGFTHEPAIQLAKQLVDLFPGQPLSRVFYSDNGSTAIESALRMALQYGQQNDHPERDILVTFDRAYHGDTLGAASLGGIPVFKGSGNQFGYSVIRVGSLEELQALTAEQTSRIAAAIIEPLIQGAAGMRLWPKGMLTALRAWCDQNKSFLILDEVMTGFGRTGKMFACQHENVIPDFLCIAKGLTGGYLPLAATLTTERVFEGFLGPGKTFFYGHSYCGSQLGCAAALGSIRNLPQVRDLRQCGMIASIELGPYAPELLIGAKVCLAARQHGLLTRPVVDNIVLMPPLSVTTEEIHLMIAAIRQAIIQVCG